MGIKILPPDINASALNFSVQNGDIRFGLSAIKNVGEGSVQAILEARERIGRFSSPFDIFQEVPPRAVNRKVIESLIKAGALDSLGWKRSQLYHLIDKLTEFSHAYQKIKSSNQSSLFGSSHVEPPPIPMEVEQMNEWEKSLLLAYEKDALGFYITDHPLAQYGRSLKGLTSHSIGQLNEKEGLCGDFKLAGIISSIRPLKTRSGDRMATFVLEDMSSRIEVVVFPDTYGKYYEHIREDLLVWIKGRLQGNEESNRLQLLEIMPLDKAFQAHAKRVVVRVNLSVIEESVFRELKAILAENPGECPVLFELQTNNSCRVIMQSVEIEGVTPSEGLTQTLEELLGENTVFIQY